MVMVTAFFQHGKDSISHHVRSKTLHKFAWFEDREYTALWRSKDLTGCEW
jgi:hypothetical protein